MKALLRIIIAIIISLISSYINCSPCSENTDSESYGSCLELNVTDESTQVCTRKSSTGKGCKETSLCTDVKLSKDEICSKLTVSRDKANTHICVNHWDLEKCQETLKTKYGLPSEEELMLVRQDDLGMGSSDNDLPLFFSTSIGAFLPIEDCYEHLLCIETNICTEVKYGGTDEKCAKLTSKEGTKCIKDPLSDGCKETPKEPSKIDGSFLKVFYGLILLLFIY